jgi:hypothetical protein
VCFINQFYLGSKHDFSVFLTNLDKYKSYLEEADALKLMAEKDIKARMRIYPVFYLKREHQLTLTKCERT